MNDQSINFRGATCPSLPFFNERPINQFPTSQLCLSLTNAQSINFRGRVLFSIHWTFMSPSESNCFAHRFLLAFVEHLVYICGRGWRPSHVAGDSDKAYSERRATSPLRRGTTTSRLVVQTAFLQPAFFGLGKHARSRLVVHGDTYYG